jgi:hypothetical protein
MSLLNTALVEGSSCRAVHQYLSYSLPPQSVDTIVVTATTDNFLVNVGLEH